MKHSRLKRIAYHEAGHAVMAYWLRRRIRQVTVIPDPDRGSLGHLEKGKGQHLSALEWVGANSPIKLRVGAEREAMISFAGLAAEQILLGSTRHYRQSGSDFAYATQCLSYLTDYDGGRNDTDELDAYSKWLYERTRATLTVSYLWQAVEALANELLARKHVGGKEARQIIKEAIKKLPAESEQRPQSLLKSSTGEIQNERVSKAEERE